MAVMKRREIEVVRRLLDIVAAMVEQMIEGCTEAEWQDLADILNEEVAEARATATRQTGGTVAELEGD